ncbi:hypothetical protein [Bacillus cereus]|uniref:Uncharacterized protein n=1 Tax=Bacillus cereus TaxID=1396 RepID=A0A9X7CLE6_BACCE|nr:hypothetical protein [Bacillus cereus]ALL11624.1 hypothetical protein BTXL6_27495 [Bacillus thuringiensis]EEM19312.1 hypothetical protein bthur0001_55150 [Bacillus thuringiensis serovar tochigiensis BGSC 4Y1]ALL21763.1 hypothetical protein BTXL6_09930 [Bacillus thuringiensis]EJR72832.1 hypothetical protein IK9_05607 [Bacillus cereus VD166]PGS77755.1 hypothetical protein COC69_18510 [Bacillus cereus]
MSMLKKYIEQRGRTLDLEIVHFLGKRIIRKADKIGKKLKNKKITPSDQCVIDFIEECNVIRYAQLPKIFNDLQTKYDLEIEYAYLQQLDHLQISRVFDCRTFGEVLTTIGKSIRTRNKYKKWLYQAPLSFKKIRLTIGEFLICILMVIMFIVFKFNS